MKKAGIADLKFTDAFLECLFYQAFFQQLRRIKIG
jgi:hypothetical protein